MNSKYEIMLNELKNCIDDVTNEIKLEVMDMVRNNEDTDYYKSELYNVLKTFEEKNRSNDDSSTVIMTKAVVEFNHLASLIFYLTKDFYRKNQKDNEPIVEENINVKPSELDKML